jgi:hypothetical protein
MAIGQVAACVVVVVKDVFVLVVVLVLLVVVAACKANVLISLDDHVWAATALNVVHVCPWSKLRSIVHALGAYWPVPALQHLDLILYEVALTVPSRAYCNHPVV